MSDAIEGSDAMLYGVSLRYKESANVSRNAVLERSQYYGPLACSEVTAHSHCHSRNDRSAVSKQTMAINRSWT